MASTKKEYEHSDAVRQAKTALDDHTAGKPGDYQSRWQSQIDGVIDEILNRKDFSYDLNGDALYQQYKDRYVNQGQLAMHDAMGQAASLTGGYGNSYAQTVGQQAYQGYLQGLNDRIPQLYQLALERYNQQGQDLYSRYSMLGTQEQQDYGRYQDSLSDWNTERAWLTDQYNTERGFDYGQYRDQVSDAQWQAQFDEDKRRYDQEWAAATASAGSAGTGKRKAADPDEETGETDDTDDTANIPWGSGISQERDQNGLKASAWDYTKNNLQQLVRSGNSATAARYMDQIVDQLNESQYKQAINILQGKG